MSNVLLLDTSFAALPIYNYLINSDYHVWVMGNRPQDLLATIAGEKWINQDYSVIDSVRTNIDKFCIDYVIPGCTDLSIATCVTVVGSSDYLDNEITNSVFADKSRFRDMCLDLKLPSPKTYHISDFPLSGCYICKPVDSYSGKGVSRFNGASSKELRKAFHYASMNSPSSNVIIQKYHSGQLYSFSAFMESHTVSEYFLVREGSSIDPFMVDTSYVIDDLASSSISILKSIVNRVSEHLNLKDGLLHTQFLFSSGEISLIEMTRRCPGDLYAMLIQHTTEYEYAAKYASYFLGIHHHTTTHSQNNILRHTITSNNNHNYRNIFFPISQPIYDFYSLRGIGNDNIPSFGNRLGIIFTKYNTQDILVENYSKYMTNDVYITY